MTRPYDVETLLTYEQMTATCTPVRIDPQTIRPTQRFAVIDRLQALAAGEPAEGPDPYPHVVVCDGRFYVHNGHHRWLVALLRQERSMLVRVQEG